MGPKLFLAMRFFEPVSVSCCKSGEPNPSYAVDRRVSVCDPPLDNVCKDIMAATSKPSLATVQTQDQKPQTKHQDCACTCGRENAYFTVREEIDIVAELASYCTKKLATRGAVPHTLASSS